ncbi:hypothetical protein [uncultured Rhodoblastus sp.]|uniref:hypothetical protein n=1 Tax=uncultured Rhodoblastus sp. TaxID=543037 RepID=UPI0025DDA979|nr:hypothetical protein [uncultured Rhodoblastus sp.]
MLALTARDSGTGDGLRRQINQMRDAFRFRFGRRYGPERFFKIDFRPFGGAQLAGADKNPGQELQGRACFRRSIIPTNGAQQAAEGFWLDNRRTMPCC